MKQSVKFEMVVNKRTYELKVFMNADQSIGLFESDSYHNASMFISDSERNVSNKQPLNNKEIAFLAGENMVEKIASLALNLDPDLSEKECEEVRKELIKIVEKEISAEIPAEQKKGVIPDLS